MRNRKKSPVSDGPGSTGSRIACLAGGQDVPCFSSICPVCGHSGKREHSDSY